MNIQEGCSRYSYQIYFLEAIVTHYLCNLNLIYDHFPQFSGYCLFSLQARRFLWARNLLTKAPCWNFPKRGVDGASQRERGGGVQRDEKFFFAPPLPLPLSFFRPRTYRKGYHFYSPQSSTVIKSKMAATTISRTRTRFRPPKIRLHCRLLFFQCFFLHNAN